MTKLITDAINKSDFKQTGYAVLIKNDTSYTSFIKHRQIKISALLPDGIILEIPTGICMADHNLSLYLMPLPLEKRVTAIPYGKDLKKVIEVLGKVSRIVPVKNSKPKRVVIVVNFSQYDVKKWKKILDAFLKVQTNVSKMLSNQ